jgi:hypothetical protein
MVNCFICNKKFKYLCHLERHLNKKKRCLPNEIKASTTEHNQAQEKNVKSMKKLIINEDKNIKMLNHKKNVINNNEKSMEYKMTILTEKVSRMMNNEVECDYCHKIIKRYGESRHLAKHCLKVPNFVKLNYVEKFNKNGNTKNKIVLNGFIPGNNIGNLNMIKVKNIKDINDYDNDDYSHLSIDDMVKICKAGYKSFDLLTDYLAKNENNINYMINNTNKNEVHVIKDNKVSIISLAEFSSAKLDRSIIILCDFIIKKEVLKRLSERNIIIFKDATNIDKFRNSIKYGEYTNVVLLKLKNYNRRNKEFFKFNNYLVVI